jgi:hypothetical protein
MVINLEKSTLLPAIAGHLIHRPDKAGWKYDMPLCELRSSFERKKDHSASSTHR